MKMPAPINQLYSDLRERKLLPIVALLVLAVIAVPVLLGSGGESAPLPPLAPAAGDDSASGTEELDPVVLAEAPALREYSKRLDSFQKRNPFRQQYKPKAAPEEDASSPAGTASTGGDTGGGEVPTSPTGTPNTGGQTVENFTIYYEIDVKAGELGKAKKQNGVELLDYLPGKKRPVLQFVGVSRDLDRALFVVSRSATDAGGDGECVPNKNTCEFLDLSLGKAHNFVYEPNGRTYRIKLNDINEIRVRDKDGAPGSGSAAVRRLTR